MNFESKVTRSQLEDGVALWDILSEHRLMPSMGMFRRTCKMGGVKVNGDAVSFEKVLTLEDLPEENVIVITKGKKATVTVALVET